MTRPKILNMRRTMWRRDLDQMERSAQFTRAIRGPCADYDIKLRVKVEFIRSFASSLYPDYRAHCARWADELAVVWMAALDDAEMRGLTPRETYVEVCERALTHLDGIASDLKARCRETQVVAVTT